MIQRSTPPLQILTPQGEDKAAVASLWQTVFQDSDAFVNLFFSRVYQPENTLVAKRGNRIISALQMIPYTIKIGENRFPSAYVCGVCTHPSERGKGIMKTLMTAAMEQMHHRAYTFSTLIPAEPWLFDFYKPFGYTIPVNQLVETYVMPPSADTETVSQTNEAVATSSYSFATTLDSHYFPFYNQKQHERDNTLLHSEYDYETILYDLTQEGGGAYVALVDNRPIGMAFAQPKHDNTIIIKDFLYNNIDVKDALIRHIARIFQAQTIEVHEPANTQKDIHPEKHVFQPSRQAIRPYGLACLLNTPAIATIPDLYMALMLD